MSSQRAIRWHYWLRQEIWQIHQAICLVYEYELQGATPQDRFDFNHRYFLPRLPSATPVELKEIRYLIYHAVDDIRAGVLEATLEFYRPYIDSPNLIRNISRDILGFPTKLPKANIYPPNEHQFREIQNLFELAFYEPQNSEDYEILGNATELIKSKNAVEELGKLIEGLMVRTAPAYMLYVPVKVFVKWMRLRNHSIPSEMETLSSLENHTTKKLVKNNSFIKKGEFWEISYEGTTKFLPDSAGIRIIYNLIIKRNKSIPATVLKLLDSKAVECGQFDKGIQDDSIDPILDNTAIQKLHGRLKEIELVIENKDRVGLVDALYDYDKLYTEKEFIEAELKKYVGIGGKPRQWSSESERARKSISANYHNVMRKIEKLLPPLAVHFDKVLSIGFLCTYNPSEPISWDL